MKATLRNRRHVYSSFENNSPLTSGQIIFLQRNMEPAKGRSNGAPNCIYRVNLPLVPPPRWSGEDFDT